MKLRRDERLLFKATKLTGYRTIFPHRPGGIIGAKAFGASTFYLTDRRLIIELPVLGTTVLDLPLGRVTAARYEKKFLNQFVRVSYAERRRRRDVLLLLGPADGRRFVRALRKAKEAAK